MTLNVQNDTGTIASANSYVTVAEFKTYWTARGVDYTTTADAVIESYLIPALSYMDGRFEYVGYRTNGRDQTTEFPREELYDYSGEYAVLVEGVPRECKEAQHEYAKIFADNGSLQPNASTTGSIKRYLEKVGPLTEETEYSPPGQNGGVVSYPVADGKIPDDFKHNASNGMAVHT